jgi:hypothetical protein
MEKKTRSLRITLLLALSLFGLLIYYSAFDHNDLQSNYGTEISYGMDLEIRWLAAADAADFAVVQDTFNHYAELVATYSGALKTDYRLDHCCEGARATAMPSGMYALRVGLDFERPDASRILLGQLIDRGYLSPGRYAFAHGMAHGDASLSLPIPGQSGKVLQIPSTAFELQMVPRVSGMDPSLMEG